MCTVDNLDTATSISKNAGIIPRDEPDSHPEYSRMEGKNFRAVVGSVKKLRDPQCTETDPAKYKMIDYLENQG